MRALFDQVVITYWPFWLLAFTALGAVLLYRWESRAPLPTLNEREVARGAAEPRTDRDHPTERIVSRAMKAALAGAIVFAVLEVVFLLWTLPALDAYPSPF